MQNFMFIFANPAERAHPGPEEMQTAMQQWMAWIDKLKASNAYVAGEALTPESKKVNGPKKMVTDGPFAESKEVVGGFFIVRAASLEAAAEMAKDCPDLPYGGTVEVRPLMVF